MEETYDISDVVFIALSLPRCNLCSYLLLVERLFIDALIVGFATVDRVSRSKRHEGWQKC